MDGATAAQRSFVEYLLYRVWGDMANLEFDFVDEIKLSDVRILIHSHSSPDDEDSNIGLGTSYIGTDARRRGPKEGTVFVKIDDSPAFEGRTVDRGIVLHELGHTLALQHQRIDRPFLINKYAAYIFYRPSPAIQRHATFVESAQEVERSGGGTTGISEQEERKPQRS